MALACSYILKKNMVRIIRYYSLNKWSVFSLAVPQVFNKNQFVEAAFLHILQ